MNEPAVSVVEAEGESFRPEERTGHPDEDDVESPRITTARRRRRSQSAAVTDDSCEPPPRSVRLEQTRYIVGCSRKHQHLLDYLNKWVNQPTTTPDVDRVVFDPPISFGRDWSGNYMDQPTPQQALQYGLDFYLANPYRATCLESEANAVTLATEVLPSQPLNQSQYGAVLYTLANRSDINSVQDIKGQRLATNQLTNMATHLCFDVLIRHGLHFLQDPQQTLLTSHSRVALQAVLDGQADVGCAATGILETFVVDDLDKKDGTTTTLLDIDKTIKILDEQHHWLTDMRQPRQTFKFPYRISTPLISGYPFQVLPHVDARVVRIVQDLILSLQHYGDMAPGLLACLDVRDGCIGSEFLNDDGQERLLPYEYVNNTECIAECWEEVVLRRGPDDDPNVQATSCSALSPEIDHNNNSTDGATTPSFTVRTTTPEQVLDAFYAQKQGNLVGYTTPLNNLVMRDVEERTGFLIKDYSSRNYASKLQSNNLLQTNVLNASLPQPRNGFCVRFRNIADAVSCPPGHFLRAMDDIFEQCNVSGLDCDIARACICGPCVEAFEVDFFTSHLNEGLQQEEDRRRLQSGGADKDTEKDSLIGLGCSKFAVCGRVPQQKGLRFIAVDNRQRTNASVTGLVLSNEENEQDGPLFTFHKALLNKTSESETEVSNYYYYFNYYANASKTGPKIVQVFIDGIEIPESPFRLMVTERDCGEDFPGQSRLFADELGNCVCGSGSTDVSILGLSCVPVASTLLPWILGPLLFLVGIGTLAYVRHKRSQEDAIWKVDLAELNFDGRPQILGRGHFGLVVLAEYKGTQVAVKSALPAHLSENQLQKLTTNNSERRTQGTRSTSGGQNAIPISFPDGRPSERLLSLSGSMLEFENQLNDGSDPQEPFYVVEVEEHTPPSRGALSSFGVESIYGEGRVFSAVEFLSWGSQQKPRSSRVSWATKLKERCRVKELRRNFLHEMRMLSKLRHPCVTTVMGAVVANHGKRCDPMLVLEYMHFGSLYDLLHNESMILERDVLLHMLKDVASGLRFLHSSKPQVIHGDLKSQNILVDEKFRAKVADFGLSQNKGFFRETKACGTPFWMAPELLRGESRNTPESDVYSFGIVLFEAFCRQDPYAHERGEDVLRRVANRVINQRPDVPPDCPTDAAALMMCCWDANPSERPTSSELDIQLRIMGGGMVSRAPTTSQQQMKQSVTGRGDHLLEQLFPPHIALALKEGQKVEPEAHEEVTLIFAEIVGSTELASRMSPSKVSDLLHRLYSKIDKLCETFNVFKVQTVGDCYMAVTNLIDEQPNHASLAANFAVEATLLASQVPIDVDEISKGMVQIRCGLHTGPVVTHVVGVRTPRFSLIGDSVNTAARMQSNSQPGRIQCSEETYNRLSPAGTNTAPRDLPFKVFKRGKIHVKGKGDMVTYWIQPSLMHRKESGRASGTGTSRDSQERRLIGWSVDTLEVFALELIRFNEESSASDTESFPHQDLLSIEDTLSIEEEDVEVTTQSKLQIGSVIDWTTHLMSFHGLSRSSCEEDGGQKPKSKNFTLDISIRTELEDLITIIYHMSKEHPYHNFEHATHTLLSSVKLLNKLPSSNLLATDPLARWSVVFATLAHDLDHPGVDNSCLVNEYASLVRSYNGARSVSEQNAIEAAWSLFTDNRFKSLREALCPDSSQLHRFQKLLIKAILATDVADKELQSIRQSNWELAFARSDQPDTPSEELQSQQASAALEMIMQASDLSYAMQPWSIFVKWSSRLHQEALVAYKAGRYDQDPSASWFEDVLNFLDSVVLPLTDRLEDAGLSSLYAKCATENKKQWVEKGQALMEITWRK